MDGSGSYSDKNKYKLISFEDAADVKKGSIIFEDVLLLSPTQREVIKQVLNYNCHHYGLGNVIIISHSVTGTGIFGILSFLTKVIFTACKSNTRNLSVVLEFYKFPKHQKEKCLREFKSSQEQYLPFILDVDASKLSKDENAEAPPESNKKNIDRDQNPDLNNVRAYVNLLPHPKMSTAIFDLITSCLSRNLSNNGMIIRVRGGRSQKTYKFNLIDYITLLVSSEEYVDKGYLLLHKFIMRKCRLPKIFIKNKQLNN